MDAEKLEQLSAFYKRHLLENVLPWWETRFVDKEHGGFLVYRDADGALLSTDKPIWVMGRITWMWSRLYNTVQKKPEWLDIGAHGVDFLLEHAFDTDGRMFSASPTRACPCANGVTSIPRPLARSRWRNTQGLFNRRTCSNAPASCTVSS